MWHENRNEALTPSSSRVGSSWESSAQVFHHQEHDKASSQHSSHHDELVLRCSLLNETHDRVRQTQHVCHIQHLFMGTLKRAPLVSQAVKDAGAGAQQVVHSSVSVLQTAIKL